MPTPLLSKNLFVFLIFFSSLRMGVLMLMLMLGTHTGSNAIQAKVELIENKNIRLSYEMSTFKFSTALSYKRWAYYEKIQ